MKIPLRWLSEYVDIPDSRGRLIEQLTMAGLEVTGVRMIGLPVPDDVHVKQEDPGPVWDRDRVLIGQVLEVKKHPNADKLKLPVVDYGAAEPKEMVTGAPNLNVGDKGQKVVLALAGAALLDGHAKEKVIRKLKPTKIRGVPSDAMVCSYYELGISDDHEGIIILEDDAPVGMPLADFMGDMVLEVDVLPNMARCLSMIGVARETAALTGKPLRYPPIELRADGETIEGQVRVEIENPELSSRYAAMLLRGVTIRPSPGWMQRRLMYAGMRPINNIVDITNYVMLEWGQPLHAFDYDVLVERAKGGVPTIVVRPARPGEKIVTLDDVERSLQADDLVIADTAGPIAIAGVMGGRDTEVTEKTRHILLESANFDPVSIRRTMRRLDLPSEASIRFSRGIHPATVEPAAKRAAELMLQHASATVCKGIVDCYPRPPEPQTIVLPLDEVHRVLGVELDCSEAKRILQALEFHVEEIDPRTLQATTPPHRLDIQEGAADLIEELARIHGYDRLPATLIADRLPEQHTNVEIPFEERVRDCFVNYGFQEIISYALTTPEREKPLLQGDIEYVTIANPISSERTVMRRSVLASVLVSAAANLRHTDTVRLFEIGRVYVPVPGDRFPQEQRRLAFFITGLREPPHWDQPSDAGTADFFDAKGIVEALAGDLHLSAVEFRRSNAAFLHPGKAAEVCVGDQSVGVFGQLHPSVAEAFDLDPRKVHLVGEFDLELLQRLVPDRFTYDPIPRYPAALRDIAIVVDEATPAAEVEAVIRAAGGKLLRQVHLFDVYRGESIPKGKKSLAYALTYQSQDKTLTDKEVDKLHRKVEEQLKRSLNAQIRGKD